MDRESIVNYFVNYYLDGTPKVLSESKDDITISGNGVKTSDLLNKVSNYVIGVGGNTVTVRFQGLVIKVDTKV